MSRGVTEHRWGWVGRTAWGTFTNQEYAALGGNNAATKIPRTGLVRDVDPGTEYASGVGPPRGTPQWVKVSEAGAGHRRYALPLPVPDQKGLCTLTDLVERLHATRAETEFTNKAHPDLDELDRVVEALIDWVAAAHRAEQSVQLLTPENTCWYHEPVPGGKPRVVLVLTDWGFFCPPAGGKPDWYSPDAAGRRYWDQNPAEMVASPLDRQRDWRTVARVLDWVLTLDGTLDRRGDVGKNEAPAIGILREVLDAKSTKPDQLKARLAQEGNRLSEAFLALPPPPKPLVPWWRRKSTLALGAILVAAAGVGVYVLLPEKQVPAPLCPDCPKNSPLYPMLSEYVAEKDRARKLDLYGQMWQASQNGTGTRREIEDRCVQKLLPDVLPTTGCPPGSSLTGTLDELDKALRGESPETFTKQEKLDVLVSLLERAHKAKPSVVPVVGDREAECYAAACKQVVALFRKDGEMFRDYHLGLDFDTVQLPAFKRLQASWSALMALSPSKEDRPWPAELDEFYK